jgi:hypothetical protein
MFSSAQAAVITFEDVSCVGFPQCETTNAIVSGGFTFSTDFSHFVSNPAPAEITVRNGTNILAENALEASMMAVDGSLFSVLRFDAGVSYGTTTIPNFVTLIGIKGNGDVVTQDITIDTMFRTYALSGFDDLRALQFSGPLLPNPGGPDLVFGYFALDNIAVEDDGQPSEVPVPASLPLVLIGLAALRAQRRN